MREVEDMDPTPVEQISWSEGATQDQTWQVAMRTGSRALVTEGGDTRASWTNLAAEVWGEGCWKHELRREGVQVGRP